MVAAIAGAPAEMAVPLADSAVRAAVLEQDDPGHLRFSHDLFRDVLYDGLPAARRSALHLSVAGLLEQRTGVAATAAEIAYHRSVAWPLGDRDRAVTALIEAAREATAASSGPIRSSAIICGPASRRARGVPTGRPRPCGGASHNRETRSHAIRAISRTTEGDPDGHRR
jgi:hypothetical protein